VAEDDQMLVRVRAASVHADVWHVMRGDHRFVGRQARHGIDTSPYR
jgi:hypothetical protein